MPHIRANLFIAGGGGSIILWNTLLTMSFVLYACIMKITTLFYLVFSKNPFKFKNQYSFFEFDLRWLNSNCHWRGGSNTFRIEPLFRLRTRACYASIWKQATLPASAIWIYLPKLNVKWWPLMFFVSFELKTAVLVSLKNLKLKLNSVKF